MRAGAGDERRPVATDNQVFEIAEQSAIGRRDDGGLEEDVFKALLKVARPWKRICGEQMVFELRGDGITSSENAHSVGFFLGFLLFEVAQMLAVARIGRGEAM